MARKITKKEIEKPDSFQVGVKYGQCLHIGK